MNIGYLCDFNSYPPQKSGSRIHAYQLIEKLTQFGCRIHTFDHEKNPRCITYPADNNGVRSFLNKIDILYVRIDGHLLYRNKIFLKCIDTGKSMPMVWEINAPAEERLWYGKRIKRAFKYISMGSMLPGKIEDRVNKLFLGPIIDREEHCRRRYAQYTDAAICMSEPLADYASRHLDIKKCVVIPNGSDPALFSPLRRNGNHLFRGFNGYTKVIYASSSHPWQGFDLVAGLAKMARNKGHKIIFIVLDSCPGRFDFARTRKGLLVYKRVNYFDVPAYLASADICLCLYQDFDWFRYGFYMSPIKMLDYMASGKPVIASRMGQMPAVIEDGKDGLLTSNDVGDIYKKILYCIEHREKAEEMGRAARDKILRYFNWERVARSTIKVFKSVL